MKKFVAGGSGGEAAHLGGDGSAGAVAARPAGQSSSRVV